MSESYIGLDPSYGAFEKQLITGDGTASTFDLDYPVAQAGQLMVSLDGIVQEPEYAFSISLSSGTPKINFADVPSNGSRIFIVYLGRQLLVATTANSSPVFDQFSGNGSTTTFALSETPVTNTAENFIVFVDNVYQRYGSSYAYTVTGSTINFTEAPPSSTAFNGILAGQSQFIESDFITNTHIKSTANISGSKINTDFSAQNIQITHITELVI